MRKREYFEDDSHKFPQKYLDMPLEELRARRKKLEERLKKFTKQKERTLSLEFEKV